MDLREVDQKKVNNVMFMRIGVDVPMLSDSDGFESDHLPARALAISNRYGYALFAHSRGFTVAKTADLVEIAQKLDANADGLKTAEEAGTVTVDVTNIRSLSLSSDELTVCVCAGGDVMFYELATLVHKSDTQPFEFWQVHRYDDNYAKDFLWSPTKSEAYLVVTSQGKLLLGQIGSVADCKVEEDILAASWSADGEHIAYVSDNRLSITTSNFATTFQHELPTHLSDEDEDEDEESELQVDAIRWVRPDSIVIGYLQVNSEGEEDEYPLFVLNSRKGNLAQEDSDLLGLVFYQLFPSVDPFVVPSGSGPYMLSDYFKPWGLMVAASRKSIDDHIVLMGWYPEDGREVLYSLELGNDVWIPRIELQESSEDNAILGLAIDRTTIQIELSDPTDESGDTKLPPCPVLVCLTLEGKLSFFSVARLGERSKVPDLVAPPSNVPDAKRSTPQPSSQLTSKPVTTTALFPASPTVVKVEPPKDVLSSSEPTVQAEVLHQGEDNKGAPSQSGFMVRNKPAIKDEKDSLFERLTSASPSFPQGAADDHPSEGSRSGSTLFSEETKKSVGIPTSPSVMTLRDLSGSVNVASTLQGLFRPFDDASKNGQVTAKQAPPPQVPWGSQLPSATPLPVTSSGPLYNAQTGPLPTASAQGKGSEGGPTANATVSFGRGSQGFPGGVPTNSTVSLGPSLQGRGFQGGPAANPSGLFVQGSQGKGFQGGPAANSNISFGPGPQGKAFQGGTAQNSNVSFGSGSEGKGLQVGAGNPSAAFGASGKSPLGSTAAPKTSQRGADRFTHSPRILQDQQSAGRTPGMTDMEVAFNAELEEVRNMSEDVDQLMSYIEGRWQGDANETPVAFTKQALEELEQGIHSVSEECKAFRVQLNKNKEAIEDLRDEEMRVDAWRIYVQSLMDQKNDSRYQELWNTRKLHPELEMKRKRLLKADQELKQHIAELEGHLHVLELKQFQQGNARRRTSKPAQSPGRFVSVQNLYNTVNSQMAIAEELSTSLAKQMEALNIKWSPHTPKSTASKILKSVGADMDDSENVLSPLPRTRLSYSATPRTGSNGFSALSVQDKERNVQETTRRRRDSMDAAWVNRETPKTTIKRAVRTRPSQNVAPNDSTVPNFRQWLQDSSNVPITEKTHFSQHAQPVRSTGMGPRLAPQSFPDHRFEGSASVRQTGMVKSTLVWPSSEPELQPQTHQQAQAEAKLQSKPQAQQQAQQQAQSKLQAKPQAQPQAQAQAKLQAKPQAQPQAQLLAKLQAQPQAQPQAQQTAPGFPSAQGSAGQVMNLNSKESMFKWANSTAVSKPVTSVSKQPSVSLFASSSAPAVSVVPAKTATTSIFSAPTVSSGLFSGSSSISNATPASSSGYAPSTSTTFAPKQSLGSLFTSSSAPAVSAVGTPATTAAASFFSAPTVTAGLLSGSSSGSNAAQAPSWSGSTLSTSITSVPKPSSGSLFASSSVPAVTLVETPATTTTTSIFSAPTVAAGLFSGNAASNATQAPISSDSAFSTSAPSIASQSSGSLFASSSVPTLSAVGTSAETSTTSIFSAQTVSAGLFSGSSPTSNAAQSLASTGSAFSTSIPSVLNQSSGIPFASSSVPAFQTSSSQSISPSPFGQSTFGQSSPFGQAAQQHIQQPFLSPGSSASSAISNATVALPPESNEEDMEEEVSTTNAGLGTFGGFSGLGLGSSATGAQTQKANPFGGSSFGNNQPFQLTPPTGGQLFRPATFNLPAAQSSAQQSGGSTFGSGFGSPGFSQNNLFSETGNGFGSPPQSAGGFGQPAQLGAGQQALGSALGAFGQTRQVGFGTPFANSGVGSAAGGGFGNTSPGGGFASAATGGGGFAKAATGGGFAGAAMGGGFAGAASGGGFAAAASGGGFGGAGGQGGGFGGGFQAFSGNQPASPGFGSGVPPVQTSLFTQMRK
ncbi:unnamed protein product [Calypogeia fissa]